MGVAMIGGKNYINNISLKLDLNYHAGETNQNTPV
jgi:hypothetical protein